MKKSNIATKLTILATKLTIFIALNS